MKIAKSALWLTFGLSLGLGACGEGKKSSLTHEGSRHQQQQQSSEEFKMCSQEVLDHLAATEEKVQNVQEQVRFAKGDQAKLEKLLEDDMMRASESITDLENEHGDVKCYVRQPKSKLLFEKDIKIIVYNLRTQLEMTSAEINRLLLELRGTSAHQQDAEGSHLHY